MAAAAEVAAAAAVYEAVAEAAAVYAVAEVAAAVYAVAEAAAVYAVAEAAAVYAVAEAAAVYAVAEVVYVADGGRGADGAEGVGAARDAAVFWGRESAGSGNASEALPRYPARRPVHLRPCFLKRRPPGRLAASTSCSRRCRPPSADCLWRLRQSR